MNASDDESVLKQLEGTTKSVQRVKETGRLGLPLEILCRIMEFRCDEFEPKGIRAFPFVAKKLVTAALSCSDLLSTLPHCYNYLASMIGPKLPELPAEYDWTALIRYPASLKVHELNSALISLDLSIEGNKGGISILFLSPAMADSAELVSRMLDHFGLDKPTVNDHPRLLVYLRALRKYYVAKKLRDRCISLIQAGYLDKFNFRKMSYLKVCEHLLRYYRDWNDLESDFKSKRGPPGRGCYRCPKDRAPDCSQYCCKNCCPGPCHRHYN